MNRVVNRAPTTTQVFIAAAEDGLRSQPRPPNAATVAQIISALKAIDMRLELVERNVREIGRHATFL